MTKYNWIVWVGDIPDYYVDYKTAKIDYLDWIDQGYDQIIIEKIEGGKK